MNNFCITGLGRLVQVFDLVLLFPFCCLIVVGAMSAHAAQNDWAEGTPGLKNGTTRDYYNKAGRLPWDNYMGDWRDANNVAQGNTPYTTMSIVLDDTSKWVEWNVVDLVREWLDETYPNQGFFLRSVSGNGSVRFWSREYGIPALRPQLVITSSSGTVILEPEVDTLLEPSSSKSRGDIDSLAVSNQKHTLIRFDLSSLDEATWLSQAILRLHTDPQQSGSEITIGVFRSRHGHYVSDAGLVPGLAAGYTYDAGIETHPNVVFFTDFESTNWQDEWTSHGGTNSSPTTVDSDPARQFAPLQGKALRVNLAEGTHTGLNTVYKFQEEIGQEPEAIYFRYYLRLGDDWNQTVMGGKMPGISGTYNVAGWGGRRSDGTNGWSARGQYILTMPSDNPLAGTTPMGNYVYHADMGGNYGDTWLWQRNYRGYIVKNQWYAVEQYVKLNTPGAHDGILRTWIDGQLAFDKTDIRFRDVDTLKIEQIWMNVYHGGRSASPYDQHLFIDNVVVARRYIGPMGQTTDDTPPTAPNNLRISQ